MEHKPTILVVEDTLIWQELFGEPLLFKGYRVQTARSLAEAQQILARQSFDMAIVDIRLSETDTENMDGLLVMKAIRDAGDPTSIAVVSGYSTVKITRDAFKKYQVMDVIEKDKFDDLAFLDLVEKGIQLARAIGFGTDSVSKTVLREVAFNQAHLLPGSAQERENLLRTMAQYIWPLAKDPPSWSSLVEAPSGKMIVQIVGWSRGMGQAVVVRLGLREVIQKESRNYGQHVKAVMEGKRATKKSEPFYQSGLGGLIYTLKGANLEPLREFASFYIEEDTPRIIDTLNTLFQEDCAVLYSQGDASTVRIDLSSVYQSTIQQVTAYREQELQDIEYDLQQLNKDDREEYLQSRGRSEEKMDPIKFVERQDFIFDSPVGVVHGDLRNGNVLVDSNAQTWLLGFYNTGLTDVMLTGSDTSESLSLRAHQSGKRNLLHDFATMEAFVRETLVTVDPKVQAELDQALCQPAAFTDLITLKDSSLSPQVEKAFQVIVRLRELASEAVNNSVDMQLYYAELLHQLLAIYLRLPDDGASKEQILASASVLAERLTHWH